MSRIQKITLINAMIESLIKYALTEQSLSVNPSNVINAISDLSTMQLDLHYNRTITDISNDVMAYRLMV